MDQKQAIILFHTVCHNHGITDDEKQAIYSSYNVTSSKQMAPAELQQAANSISQESQQWRLRVMGAIGGYLKRNKIESNQVMIKAIACRAAKATDFNKIPVRELRKIYNTFLKKGKEQRAQGEEQTAVLPHAPCPMPYAINNDNTNNHGN